MEEVFAVDILLNLGVPFKIGADTVEFKMPEQVVCPACKVCPVCPACKACKACPAPAPVRNFLYAERVKNLCIGPT